MALEAGTRQKEDAMRTSRRIVFLAALFATILGGLYLIGLVGKLIVDGTVHSVSAPPVQAVSAVVGLLWNITLVILFVGLRRQAAADKAVFAELALVFMALCCAASCINWFAQLILLPKAAQTGDPTVIALIDVHNSGSIMYAVEHLGWGVFYGLAAIFAGIAARGSGLNAWSGWLFIAGGVLSLLHVVGMATGSQAVSDVGYIAWGVLLPATTMLISKTSRTSR